MNDSATSATDVSATRVSWTASVAYSLGNAAETILSRSFELFVLFFYTQVLGLSGTLAGLAILVALVVDGVMDPLVGSYSDSLKSRFGRRHTLMFAAALPTSLFYVLMFAPPASLTGVTLALWLAATGIGLRASITFFHIPWSSQVAEMTTVPRARVTLAVMRSVFGVAAQFVVLKLAFDVFFVATPEYIRGQENPAAYLPFGLAFGALLGVVIIVSALGTYSRMRAIEKSQPVNPARFTVRALVPAWRDMILRYVNFRSLFFGSLSLMTAFSMFNALSLYLGSYFWGLSGTQIKVWQFGFLIGGSLSFILGKPIVDRVPPKWLFSGGIALGTALFAMPIFLQLLGLLPGGVEEHLLVLRLTNGLAGFVLGIVMIVSAVIASETADDYEQRTAIKSTAVLFGFVFLSLKLASGFGKLIAGLLIDFIALPSAKDAASITAAQMSALGWSCVAALAVLGSIGVLIFSAYRSPDRSLTTVA